MFPATPKAYNSSIDWDLRNLISSPGSFPNRLCDFRHNIQACVDSSSIKQYFLSFFHHCFPDTGAKVNKSQGIYSFKQLKHTLNTDAKLLFLGGGSELI